MIRSKIAGTGFYVPDQVVTNDNLSARMDTSDQWIQERTGIKERRHIKKGSGDTTAIMGAKAGLMAIDRAGINKSDIDFIIFATLSPDFYFPGPGVQVQEQLEISEVGALDIRNQCSGFVYALSVADQFIKTGMYKNILVIGSENHSGGLDFTDRGRGVSVIFGDGAGAIVMQPTADINQGVLSTHLHSEGKHAKELALLGPSTERWVPEILAANDPNDISYYPYMNGNFVFKHAVVRFEQVIQEALQANNLTASDINLLVPHQANLRISQYIQAKMKLTDNQVMNNIQKYGNTTAASIPIALNEAWETGRINKGDLICLAAFGSGFTWASALIKW
jgi:3-oxoacyl-[acyl-carrier-protein] synthase-3